MNVLSQELIDSLDDARDCDRVEDDLSSKDRLLQGREYLRELVLFNSKGFSVCGERHLDHQKTDVAKDLV